jgi:hypothetical protein
VKRKVPQPRRIDVRRECPICGLTAGHHFGCPEPLCLVERVYVAVDALPGELRGNVEEVVMEWRDR